MNVLLAALSHLNEFLIVHSIKLILVIVLD